MGKLHEILLSMSPKLKDRIKVLNTLKIQHKAKQSTFLFK